MQQNVKRMGNALDICFYRVQSSVNQRAAETSSMRHSREKYTGANTVTLLTSMEGELCSSAAR
jgi:hypothetical protein